MPGCQQQCCPQQLSCSSASAARLSRRAPLLLRRSAPGTPGSGAVRHADPDADCTQHVSEQGQDACQPAGIACPADPSSVSRTMRSAVPRSFDLSCRHIRTNLLPPQLCAPGSGRCAPLDAARLLTCLVLRLQRILLARCFLPFLVIIFMRGSIVHLNHVCLVTRTPTSRDCTSTEGVGQQSLLAYLALHQLLLPVLCPRPRGGMGPTAAGLVAPAAVVPVEGTN